MMIRDWRLEITQSPISSQPMKKIRTIISKEWAEVFKNRLVLFSVIFLPLILTALPLATIWGMSRFPASTNTSVSPEEMEFFGDLCVGLSENECVMVYTLSLYTLLFMILPVMIPVTIAAYSIVGEKATRSLEPLLATPITDIELLTGKAIAAIVPAILATWLAYFVYAIGAVLMLGAELTLAYVFAPVWVLAIFVVGPLMTFLSVSIAIMVSARVTDPRVAEQLSGLVVLPIILLLVGQSVGWIVVSRDMIYLIGVIVLILDVVLGFITIKSFQRETILTRWK
ncbi:MAG: ABC transporter permease subunit [Anaerolineae bacterium]|nr:ABC transporter permease subunit [Anaerolineae bacterium]